MKKFILLLIVPFLSFSQVNYETQIQPILNANCIECHQGNAGYFGGLALTSYEELIEGGDTEGGIISTGLLEEYITTGYMPAYGSGNQLSNEEINLIVQWISEGALGDCIDGDLDSDGICDEIDNCIGTWIEDIETGPCNMFDDESTCISFGCSWTNEYTGVWLWEDVCGWGNQTYEIDNSYCDELDDCNSDIDNDGICEDHCEEWSMTVIVDCECSFFNPNTYTVFFNTVYEESCELWEDCYCECMNDLNENGICDEDEEGVVIEEFFNNKKLEKTIDAIGRDTNQRGFNIEIYDDGSVEKKYVIE